MSVYTAGSISRIQGVYNGDHDLRYFEVCSPPGRGRRTNTTSSSESVILVQAEVLTEAFNVNLDALVTKDYLAARFAEQTASIDTRFAEQKSYTDTKFEQVNARFTEQDAKINANFRILLWMIGIVQAFVILPYLERLLAL